MMFRGFCFGNGIIWMRLPFFTLLIINTSTVQVSLANAFWIVSFLAVGVSEFYVALDKFFLPPPARYFKDHKRSFNISTTGLPGQGMAPVEIEVDECELLPDNTSMKFTFRVKNHHQVPVFFPGQHVALCHKGVLGSAREYSPIVTDEHLLKGQISLWIRLVKGGVMSTQLRAYCDQYNQIKSPSDTAAEHHLPGVQLNPLETGASRHSTEKAYAGVAPPCPFLLSVSSSRLAYFPNNYQCLVMAATGTGLAPLLPLIQAVLNNPNDRTRIYLIYACNGDEDYGRKLLDYDLGSNDSAIAQLEIEYKMRGTEHSRITVASIESAVENLAKHGKLKFSEESHHAIQVHLSGPPPFVKSLSSAVVASKKLGLASRSLQLVSWGYTDR
jgi:ferredoxin-NADP reductase